MRRGRKPLLLGAVFALSAAAAGADSTPSAWTEVRSEHFRLLGNETPGRVQEMTIAAERLLQALDLVVPGWGSESREPITCAAFDSFETYRLFVVTGSGSGYLIPHGHGAYAAFVASKEPTRQIYRQVVKLRLETRLPALPEWFRQGMAEIYSAVEIEGEKLVLGGAIPTHLRVLGSPPGELPVPLLIAAALEETAGSSGFEAGSWAVVHYLLFSSPSLRRGVDRYLQLISRLERPRRALTRAFGLSADELAQRVAVYVQQAALPGHSLDIGALPEVEISTRRLSKREAVLAFAELSLHTSASPLTRLAETLRGLVADESASAALWTTLGEAEAALGNPEAAHRALRRAVEIDPEAYKAWLLLGESLAEGVRLAGSGAGAEHIDEAASALERAVALRPESLAAWDRLSFVYAAQARPSERAIAAAEKALELRPGRTDLVFNLLLMRAKLNQPEQVRELLDRLAALGADEAQVTSGREMLLQLTLRGTRELMRANRLDDAIGVLAEVQARTTSEQLRATALEWIAQVELVKQYNLFVERYNQAVRAYDAADWEAAIEALDRLAAIARPGEQRLTTQRLRDEVEYWRD